MKPVCMWTWTVRLANGKEELCRWAEPSRRMLMQGEKPSPESRPVRIYCYTKPKRKR